MNERITRDIDKPVMLILLIGMVISMLLIVVGIVLFFMHPEPELRTVLPVGQAVNEAMQMHTSGWLSLGLFMLIITPVARVVIAIFSFAWIKDWKYALVSMVVLTAMMAGIVMGKG